jgi:hypothetical protein
VTAIVPIVQPVKAIDGPVMVPIFAPARPLASALTSR